jgi:hypothetical protein
MDPVSSSPLLMLALTRGTGNRAPAAATPEGIPLVAIANRPGARLRRGTMAATSIDAAIRTEVREHRAAIALHHMLCGLCVTQTGVQLRGALIAVAGKLARDIVARKLPGVGTADEWAACLLDMSREPLLDMQLLARARSMGTLLGDGTVDRRLTLEPDRVRASIRAGTVAAIFWKWQPFGEEAEARDADQMVPDIDDMASRARDVIHRVVACPTQDALEACLERLISPHDVGTMETSMKAFIEDLQGARRLIDDPASFAAR